MGEVQHGGVLGEGGEGVEALHAAVDQDSVGGRYVKTRGKVVEGAGAAFRAGGIDFSCVIFHDLQQGRHLVRVYDLTVDQGQLSTDGGGHVQGPGVQPGQGGGAGPGVACQLLFINHFMDK